MKKFFSLFLVLALVMLAGGNGALAAKEKPVLLKVPVCFSTELPALGSAIAWMAKHIKLASAGSVQMKIYEPGKLVAPFEILEAVSKGKINAGYATAGYWAGKIPAAPLFGAVPFGPEAPEYLAWLWYGDGMKLYQEMYDQAGYNVKVLVAAVIAPETSGWFKEPVNKPADLKGMRMRFYGLGGKVMQKMGVQTSLLPAGEIFPALEKKAIDATEFSMPAIDKRLGFYKIAKYNYYPGWHQQATVFELLINKDAWKAMSEHQQMVIEMMCKATVADQLAFSEAIQAPVIKENVTKRGVINKYWSPEFLDAYRKAWEEVAAEEAARDAMFKKVYNNLQKFRADYRYWQSVGFLPRPKPPKM